MTVTMMIGDCRTLLKAMPAESVHCVVTSPPYWGLRDYNVAGQLGMEPTLGEHISTMVDVFREIRRVLRSDGTCWLNYGDCYATSPNGRSASEIKAIGNDDRTFRDKPFSTVGPIQKKKRITAGVKRTDTNVGGWGASDDSLRWRGGPIYDPTGGKKGGGKRGRNKGNAYVPSGRICAGGYLKLKDLCMMANRLAIALQDDGWYVRSEIIWHKPNPMPESTTDRPTTAHEKLFLLTRSANYWYDAEAVRTLCVSETRKMPDGWDTGVGAHGSYHRSGREKGRRSGNKKRKRPQDCGRPENSGSAVGRSVPWEGNTANLRNVWTIPTAAFSEAHFATFPPALVEPCIKAGCPKGGIVLDPFGGSGTVGLVAENLLRDSILMELNPEYAEMARNRIMVERQVSVVGMPAPSLKGLPLLEAMGAK